LFDRLHVFELVLFSFWTIFILVIMGLSDQMLILMDYWMNRGIPFIVVLRILFYRLPSLLQTFLPVSALFASVIVAVRWVRDQDLIIFETSGVRLRRLMFPVIVFGLFLTLFQFWIQERVAPQSQTSAETLFSQILTREPQSIVEVGQLSRDQKGRTFLASGYDQFRHVYLNILMMDPTQSPPLFVVAKEARFVGKQIRLDGVNAYSRGVNNFLEFQMKMSHILIPFDDTSFQGGSVVRVKTSREMTLPELNGAIQTLRKAGLNPVGLRVDRDLRYSLPFSNLILAWMGALIVVSILKGKKGLLRWIVMGLMVLLVSIIYLFLIALMRSLGIGAVVAPVVAAWAPLVVLVCIGGLIRLIYSR
jgi:lipopolysaccharide export system permease protein